MKFIVLGSGLTGFQLAKRLSGTGGDVVLIDDNPDAARLAEARLDCMVIQAKGNDLAVLERAGLSQADALIALTPSDEVNVIACAACPSLLKIARVRNDAYYPDRGEKDAAPLARPVCGIDFMVQPDSVAADVICDTIFQGAVNYAFQFEESNFLLVPITVAHGSTLDGARVKDVRRLTKKSFIICCIETEDEAFIPSGETILESGERVGVLTDRNSLSEIFRLRKR